MTHNLLQEDVQSLLKILQLCTRQLHHMCGHSKVRVHLDAVLYLSGLHHDKRVSFCADPPGHGPDHTRATAKEDSGDVCVPGKSHAGPQQLPRGILAGQSQKPRPAGEN